MNIRLLGTAIIAAALLNSAASNAQAQNDGTNTNVFFPLGIQSAPPAISWPYRVTGIPPEQMPADPSAYSSRSYVLGSDSLAYMASNDLLVYPNPVIDQARIDLGTASVGNVYVDIIDLNGHLDRAYQYDPGTNVLQVDMSRLPQGLYSVRVHGKGMGGHNLKVVKE